MIPERRRHPRVSVHATARLLVEGRTLEAQVRDICRDAVLIETEQSWSVGTPVSLSLTLVSGGAPLEVRGTVIRVAEVEQHPGVAILFADVTPELATRIDVWIAQRD